MALISHALSLVFDQNGVIAIQWFLDSDLPGRHTFIAPVLKGSYTSICLSKHASCVIAKLVHPAVEASARDMVIEELFTSASLGTLLQEPLSAAILLRCLSTARPEQKIRLAHLLEPHLARLPEAETLPHLQRIREEVVAAREFVNLEQEKLGFAVSNALLTHAVGGPVTNSSIVRLSAPFSVAASARPEDTTPSNPVLSFGTVTAPLLRDNNASAAKTETGDRLSFGPNLAKRVDNVRVHRPLEPS